MKRTPFITVGMTLCALVACAFTVHAQTVRVITIDGSINPASAKYVHDALADAAKAGDAAVVLELNTPGGLLQATRNIVSDFLASRVPVIVYVHPAGGQAASAGAFITIAAHIAAMAPGTNIGAAHPVSIGEGEQLADSTNVPMTKATNDAAAFARTVAEKRGRNVQWAEQAVRSSVSATETEALELGVVDLIAKDLPSLLDMVDGDTVETASGMVELRVADAELLRVDMNFQETLLDILSDPNIAYILMMLGIYGLFFELYNPGAVFPGVVGGICLILAFYSMNTLPINYAGLALIVFGIVLFLLEIKVVSHGLLSVGGIVALFLGLVMLLDTPEGLEFMEISLSVIITVTACSAAFFLFIVGKGIAILRKKPATGVGAMVGETGLAMESLDPDGRVAVHGEIWNAHALGGSIAKGHRVVVTGVHGMLLHVEAERDTLSSDS